MPPTSCRHSTPYLTATTPSLVRLRKDISARLSRRQGVAFEGGHLQTSNARIRLHSAVSPTHWSTPVRPSSNRSNKCNQNIHLFGVARTFAEPYRRATESVLRLADAFPHENAPLSVPHISNAIPIRRASNSISHTLQTRIGSSRLMHPMFCAP